MALSATVFEIKQDICQKTLIFHTPFVFNLHDPLELLRILPNILIQTVRLPVGDAKRNEPILLQLGTSA